MKLVIDIDDEYYATITNKIKAIRNEVSKNGYAKNNDVVPIGWISIADGIPLPKGFGDLKDTGELLKCGACCCVGCKECEEFLYCPKREYDI